MDYNPTGKIQNKHLLTLKDYSREEIYELLHLAIKLKKEYKDGKKHDILNGKTLAMIFAKSSTRTRVSFYMGMRQLGGDSLFLSTNDIQLGRSETIEDTAKVISRMGLSGIMIRTFLQSDVEALAQHGTIPVINGLTDDYHPCQALADVLTLFEHKGKIAGQKMAYLGDGNNVTHSLMIISAKLGMKFAAVCPKGYEPNAEITEYCRSIGGDITITANIPEGVKDADVLYTDVFFSMGQQKSQEKEKALMPYQLNMEIYNMAKPGCITMHCLPAHRGEEVTEDVLDGPMSVVFDEAENRLHAQKAVLALLLKD
jgi:ornithine carbamoyltransferase